MERKLIHVLTADDLKRIGFEHEHDGTDDPRGTSWHIKNNSFHLYVDAWGDVFLCRVNPDTDPVQILADSIHDLEMAVEFIKP